MLLLGWGAANGQEGDPRSLVINEVLASNRNTPPADYESQFENMVEIYNPTDLPIGLKSLILADKVSDADTPGVYKPVAGSMWKFQAGSILPKGFVLVYCDGDTLAGTREPHATFKLDKDGEVVALFTANEELIDMVVFDYMPEGRSFGCYPDGNKESRCYLASPSFKNCSVLSGGCLNAGNSPCGNMSPLVDLKPNRSISDAAGASPAAGAPVPLVVGAWDEKVGGVAGVKVLYQVDGGTAQEIALQFDAEATAALTVPDRLKPDGTTKQDLYHSIWTCVIPGQPASSVVQFTLAVTDDQGATGLDPTLPCADPPEAGCRAPFRYRVGYADPSTLTINEVCPLNLAIVRDPSDFVFEDWFEITAGEDIDLSGIWVSQNPFRPDANWQFPAGSTLKKDEHLIIWCDDDGKDTDPAGSEFHTAFNLNSDGDSLFLFRPETYTAAPFGYIDGIKMGPTAADTALTRCPDGSRSAPFVPILEKKATTAKETSPGEANLCDFEFLRGDPDGSGSMDLSDSIFVLSYLFLGGSAPACQKAADANDTGEVDVSDPIYILMYLFGGGPEPPAPFGTPGTDPTPDDLGCS